MIVQRDPLPRRRVSWASSVLIAALLLVGCNDASHPVPLDEAIVAAVAGDVPQVETLIAQLKDGSFGGCAASDTYALLQSVAAFNRSAKSRDDASAFMAAHGSSISEREREWGGIGCESDVAIAAYQASLPKLVSTFDATERAACDVLLEQGVDTSLAVDVALLRGRGFSCSRQAIPDEARLGRYLTALPTPAGEEAELKSCERFTDDDAPLAAYRANVAALGQPFKLDVSSSGVSARWQGDYTLLASVEPNFIRRTQGQYPTIALRTRVSANDGNHFSEDAATTARSSCLTEAELSRIIISAAR